MSNDLVELLKRFPVVYIEHRRTVTYSYGRFYVLTDNQSQDITHEIADLLEPFRDLPMRKILNPKTGVAVKCIQVKDPMIIARDLSDLFFDRWDVVKAYPFTEERIF